MFVWGANRDLDLFFRKIRYRFLGGIWVRFREKRKNILEIHDVSNHGKGGREKNV